MSPRLTRRRLLAITASAALSATGAQAERWRGIALGARAEITLRGTAEWRARAFATIQAEVAQAEALFSLYRADSWLSGLNAKGRARLPDTAATLLREIAPLHHATQGQFDPTIQPLWRALAEGWDQATAAQAIGWHKVTVHGSSVVLAPGQALSLNGIAQGWATDRVADRLRDLGARHVLVQMGELRALDGPFRIGLPDGGAATLRDRALATSAPGALRLGPQGHIVSPSGRAPLWAALTVEADRATLADGLSTAGIFLSPQALRHARERLPGVHRIWTLSASGDIASI